jgi:hypothetical protein
VKNAEPVSSKQFALLAKGFDFEFVPVGVLHTNANAGDADFEAFAFFSKADPLPEVSLSVATAFFPHQVSKAGMTQYGDVELGGDPLSELRFRGRNPYLVQGWGVIC